MEKVSHSCLCVVPKMVCLLSVDRKVFQKPYQSLISAWIYQEPKSAFNLRFKNFRSGWTSERSQLAMIASFKTDGCNPYYFVNFQKFSIY
ncbi:hypothetical protein [Nostoc sp.]|uniref:hypothetical protein n=1 Tax=Nostoc sp. TaxID=1180 RepID=UPI002FFA9A48